MICSVLMGKTFQCTALIHGADLMAGYDSHTAPGTPTLCARCIVIVNSTTWWCGGAGGQEWVIFNPAQVLPCYLVSLSQAQ